ncbi:class I SAM-dependent methyltransferase [Arthrobacter sp. TMN-37]
MEPDARATRTAYDTVADRYADLLRFELDGLPLERALLGAFAELARSDADAPLMDLGCGPGRVAAHLASLGASVRGIDLSPGMIAAARRDHPSLAFEVGSMERLDLADRSASGVLAWYSLIHIPPPRLGSVLAEFSRVLRPGGPMLLAFQSGNGKRRITDAYGSRVSLDAYRIDPEILTGLLQRHGFALVPSTRREPQGGEKTAQAFLLARRL